MTVVGIERLDEDGLLALTERTDELGVLSVYVDADPSGDPSLNAAAIDLKNRFRQLQRGVEQSGELAAALERLWPETASLASPTASGRGRIAFAALGGAWAVRLDSAMRVTSRVVLDNGPFIHPLLELLDEGRPAGVVVVSAEDARMLEWRLGSLRLVRRMEHEYVQAPHERAGQIGGGPPGQFHTPTREQRAARERQRMRQFLDQVAGAAAELAADRNWERILVSGGERWTEPAISRFPHPWRDRILADSRVLNGLDDAALARAVTDRVHQQHNERERELVEQVRAAGRSGAGALGLSEVAAALNAGRVAHLVYDPEVRYAGTVGTDGALYSGDELGPDGKPGTPEPRLTERLVERALRTGARVSPVEGAAQDGLRDAAGVAALLRW